MTLADAPGAIEVWFGCGRLSLSRLGCVSCSSSNPACRCPGWPRQCPASTRASGRWRRGARPPQWRSAFRLDEMFAGGGELATLVVVPAKVTTLTSTCFARNTSAITCARFAPPAAQHECRRRIRKTPALHVVRLAAGPEPFGLGRPSVRHRVRRPTLHDMSESPGGGVHGRDHGGPDPTHRRRATDLSPIRALDVRKESVVYWSCSAPGPGPAHCPADCGVRPESPHPSN